MERLWTKEGFEKFLGTCFSKFNWRSLGLLSCFVYETGQKHTATRNLKWEAFNHDLSTVVIGRLCLPLSKNLKEMVEQQKGDWDFQDFVFPYKRNSDNAYRPLSEPLIRQQVLSALEEAGLPSDLTMKSLRKTALLDMYKEGISRYELMCLTGIGDSKNLDKLFGVDPEAAYAAALKRKRPIKIAGLTGQTKT